MTTMNDHQTHLNVVQKNTCCQCGICEAACNNIKIERGQSEQLNTDFSPVVKNENVCKKCDHKRCIKVCPISDDPVLRSQWIGPIDREEPEFGNVEQILLGYARDENILDNAASGGVATSIIKYFLEQELAHSAIVATKDPDDPLGGRFIRIEDSKELLQSCSSIYSPVPMGGILKPLIREEDEGKVVIVGRPCQLRAIGQLEKLYPALKERIVLKIAIFCAWMISRKGVKYLSGISGVKNENVIESVDYRKGVWPGRLKFSTRQGEFTFPFCDHVNTNGTFYYPISTPFMPESCARCFDTAGTLGDVSLGDPWNLGITGKKHGYTLIITRNERSKRLFENEIVKTTYVDIVGTLDPSQLDQSQGNTMRIKQSGMYTNDNVCLTQIAQIRRYNKINRVYGFVAKKVRMRWILYPVSKGCLSIIWKRLRTRLDKTLFVDLKD